LPSLRPGTVSLAAMFRVKIIRHEILAFNISEFVQALVECRVDWCRPRLDCHNADVPARRPLRSHLTRMDFIVLDELGYLPFAQSGGQLFPPRQPPLRANIDHCHHKPRLR
jgi:hypothetical protein